MPTIWTNDLALKEDGERIVPPATNTFEWWYFDMMFDDHSTCVVTYFNSGNQPELQFNISPPTGKYFQEEIKVPFDHYSAAQDRCLVRLGESEVEGDLHTYRLRAIGRAIRAELTLTGHVPGWRVGPYLPPDQASKSALGEQVVIPAGTVVGRLFYDNAWHDVKGTCYHDHQWGASQSEKPAGASAGGWYWGSVRIQEYAAWFAQIYTGPDPAHWTPIASVFTWSRFGHTTYDDDLNALAISQLQGGIEVKWTSNLGYVDVKLPSPKEIANLNGGNYLRYLSQATVTSNYPGEAGRTGVADAIWEINHF